MAGLRRLRAEGLVAEVGVSSYGQARWQEAERYLGAPVLVNQVPYNLLHRDPEQALLPWATAMGRLVVAAQPFATGLLSGAYHGGKRVTGTWRIPDPLYSSDNLGRTAGLVGTLGEVARAHDATMAQVALAYVLRHPNVVAVPGAATAGQLAENAEAADLELNEDECQGLAEAASHSPAYEAGVSRPRLWAAKHWVRGARLQVATARETRTLEAIEQSCSPRGPDRGAPVPLSMRTVIAGFSARRGGARTRGRWRARLGLSAGPYLMCGRARFAAVQDA